MEGLVVLVAFVVAFVGIAVWTYLPGNKIRMKEYGEIPFNEESHGR